MVLPENYKKALSALKGQAQAAGDTVCVKQVVAFSAKSPHNLRRVNWGPFSVMRDFC